MQNVKNEHKNDAVKQENKSFKTEDKFHKDDRNYRDDKLHKNDINHKKDEQKPSRTYKYLAFVSFKESKKVYSFGSDQNDFHVGDDVVVETVRGLELGKIVKESEAFIPNGMEIKPIIRKATPKDLKNAEVNVEKAKKALVTCNECIHKLGLDMNLIEAEYTLDCSKIIFVYVADERVDFRELLKELAAIFKCRIELRQIGPRNKSKIVGGLGSCGMETCCSRFLNDFDVVSINMAKNQLLALNIQKLSGQCGKLMCCLKFEDDQYKKLREGLPKLNSQIEYKGSRYRITSMNVLLQQVKIENKEDVQFLTFKELWPDIDFKDR
ncbi:MULTISPECIES: regulatory iron-sulfur-containing complex subunit RicT [Bacillota]|jgi:cell fate regulator YaaT (PSP1 superfamily)|uniref:Stage 0 sporulation protein n=2 Tax=Amedibacillus TaxID=2749846 RepID=A0A7G9GRL4_9FIRM|nr:MULTISPECIES: regulatory iron-sulfur-containing complex subunit RicT [Bacillota]QNM13446.1 stage 0 sporulation protein [[Eubacterium] hominis]MCH4286954.1 stage 0 sporulation protein [Amedibacillus hominis]RGB49330.1 stage 0 sporulation protein [Absiella sp. AM22-9]RGB53911.1 stage 0 sporulation protein [Absiella sp. AM10-20]RGB68452.1 stage 0 sporulation protein [Absiella sp. AM09-45]